MEVNSAVLKKNAIQSLGWRSEITKVEGVGRDTAFNFTSLIGGRRAQNFLLAFYSKSHGEGETNSYWYGIHEMHVDLAEKSLHPKRDTILFVAGDTRIVMPAHVIFSRLQDFPRTKKGADHWNIHIVEEKGQWHIVAETGYLSITRFVQRDTPETFESYVPDWIPR